MFECSDYLVLSTETHDKTSVESGEWLDRLLGLGLGQLTPLKHLKHTEEFARGLVEQRAQFVEVLRQSILLDAPSILLLCATAAIRGTVIAVAAVASTATARWCSLRASDQLSAQRRTSAACPRARCHCPIRSAGLWSRGAGQCRRPDCSAASDRVWRGQHRHGD